MILKDVFEEFDDQENELEPDYHKKRNNLTLIEASPAEAFKYALFNYSSSSASRFLRSFPSGWSNMSKNDVRDLLLEINENEKLDSLYALIRFLHCTVGLNGLDYYLEVCDPTKGGLYNHVKGSYDSFRENLRSKDDFDLELLGIKANEFSVFMENWKAG